MLVCRNQIHSFLSALKICYFCFKINCSYFLMDSLWEQIGQLMAPCFLLHILTLPGYLLPSITCQRLKNVLKAGNTGLSNPACYRLWTRKQLCTLGDTALKNSKNVKVLTYRLKKCKQQQQKQNTESLFASFFFIQLKIMNNISSPIWMMTL